MYFLIFINLHKEQNNIFMFKLQSFKYICLIWKKILPKVFSITTFNMAHKYQYFIFMLLLLLFFIHMAPIVLRLEDNRK